MSEDNLIKSIVDIVLNEQADLRLRQDLVNITCRLTMVSDAHVPDTLTRIRVLPTVAVVGQNEPVTRAGDRNTLLEIYVKFLPRGGSDYKNLSAIGKLIKGLPGVKIVTILTLNNKKVLYKGKPIVI
ncbi:hypothetical protein CMI47_18980 [Candidatus Pacearchaeota archaeon]|nr:hypothetical protein [Candidatus Pacearchaeota archaeon]|tara:strand:- start:11137 stop:11517 length:381 start_codon:yes stop_codon:yes gene_type:complete